MLVKLQDAFFDGVACDDSMDQHRPGLADAMGAIGRLLLHGRIPPGVEQEDMIGRRQIQTGAPRFEGNQHDGGAILCREAADDTCSILG